MAKNVLQELVVNLNADTSNFTGGMSNAEGILNRIGKVGGMMAATVGAGIAAAGAAVTGIAVKSVNAAAESQSIQAQLNAVIKSTGGIAGVTTDKVNALASSLGSMTPFEDDAIVSGQNMLLTFTNIGASGGIFDQTTKVMLDMSQAMGQDLKSSALQLGKALNDPTKGITALTRVGVSFTDEQKNMIKSLQESGDMAGAQKIILNELNKEFGGSAEAAGKTFSGALEIAKNALGNVYEAIGAKLLPVLTDVANKFATWINAPETQAMIEQISNAIADFAGKVVAFIPVAFQAIKNLFDWLNKNKPIVIGVLAAIGAFIAVWAVGIATSAVTAMISFLPIVGIFLGIAAVVALVAKAWESDFLGIRTKTTESIQAIVALWNNTLKPAILAIANWFSELIGKITGFVTKFWEIGSNIVSGIWNGIQSKASEFTNNVKNFFKGIVDGVKKTLGIHSPSTVFAGIGKNMALGLQEGFNTSLNKMPEFSGQAVLQANYGTSYNSSNSEIVDALGRNSIDYEKLAKTLRVELSKYLG
jgi:hypothetical protein